MTNPVIHILVLALAILIPGGLVAYLAWVAYKAKKAKFSAPTPKDAREAFLKMYPPDSLRAQSRSKQLDRVKAWRRRNP